MADKQFRIVVTIDGQDYATDDLRKVNQELDKTQANAKQTAGATGETSNSFFNLKNAVTGAGLALAATKLLDIAGDAAELGQQVRITEQRYEALTSTIGDSNDILNQLRTTTLGIADDMTLQTGATDYLSRGLATNQEELNKLIELAVKLKQPTDSASDAINNFGLLLANESVLRLDSFGISGAKVRERIEELIESGEAANRSEAFRLAVMEEGANSLERLGEAADASGTEFERLKVTASNAASDIAEAISTNLVEPASAALNDLIGLIQAVGEHGLEDVVIAAQGGDVEVARRESFVSQRSTEIRMEQLATRRASGQVGLFDTGVTPADEILARQLALIEYNNELARTTEAERKLAEATQEQDRELMRFNELTSIQTDIAHEQARAHSEETGLLEGMTDIYENLTAESLHFQTVGGVQILSHEEADFATDWAGLMTTSFEQLKTLAEQSDFEFITQEQLDQAESMVTQVEDLGDAAQDAATAFDKMSLSQLFGQTSGGALAELHDMILSNIEDEDLRAQVEIGFDLESGQATTLSQQVENEFAPLLADITEQYGEMAGADAANRFLDAVKSGQLEGLNPVDMQAALREAIGYQYQPGTGTGEQITIEPGDTVSALAGERGMTVQEFLEAAGLPSSLIRAGDTLTLGQEGVVIPITLQPTIAAAGEGGVAPPGGSGQFIEGGEPQLDPFEEIFVKTDETATRTEDIAMAWQSISDIDLSAVLDDLTGDLLITQDEIGEALAKMEGFNDLDISAIVPLKIVLDDQTGFELGQNREFVRAVSIVMAGFGVYLSQQGARE